MLLLSPDPFPFAFTFVGAFGNHWWTNVLDFFNPASDLKDIVGLFNKEGDDCENY